MTYILSIHWVNLTSIPSTAPSTAYSAWTSSPASWSCPKPPANGDTNCQSRPQAPHSSGPLAKNSGRGSAHTQSAPPTLKWLSTGTLASDAFPFGEELAKLNDDDDDEAVAVVDIAGGQGHIMEEIRRLHPGLKGRFVVQDLASTFEAVEGGPPPGVEFMAYDMFTPQPLRDAHGITCAIYCMTGTMRTHQEFCSRLWLSCANSGRGVLRG